MLQVTVEGHGHARALVIVSTAIKFSHGILAMQEQRADNIQS